MNNLISINGISMPNPLQLEVDRLLMVIAQLRQKQAPAIVEIAKELQDAGLNNWGNRASTAAAEISEECGDAVMAAIFEIRDIALEMPSWNQCDRIRAKFEWVCETTKTALMPEQAIALQAILDVGSPSTGPVAADYLKFC